jgi:hypothetical protein
MRLWLGDHRRQEIAEAHAIEQKVAAQKVRTTHLLA